MSPSLQKKINLEFAKIMEWLQINKFYPSIEQSKFTISHITLYQIQLLTLKKYVKSFKSNIISSFNFFAYHFKWEPNMGIEEHVDHVSNKMLKVIGNVTISKLKRFIPSNIVK